MRQMLLRILLRAPFNLMSNSKSTLQGAFLLKEHGGCDSVVGHACLRRPAGLPRRRLKTKRSQSMLCHIDADLFPLSFWLSFLYISCIQGSLDAETASSISIHFTPLFSSGFGTSISSSSAFNKNVMFKCK